MPTISSLNGSSSAALGSGSTLASLLGAGGSTLAQLLGINSATGSLTQGLNNAQGQTTLTAQQLQQLLSGLSTQEQQNLSPYLSSGNQSIQALDAALGPGGNLGQSQTFSFNPQQALQNPSYQFDLNQALQSINSAADATGTRYSGATLQAIDQYAQNYATNNVNNVYNQDLSTFQTNQAGQQQQYNQLMGAATLGQNAATTSNSEQNQIAGLQTNAQLTTGQQLAQLMAEQGQVGAAGALGNANAVSNGISQALGLTSSSGLLKQLLGNGNSAGTSTGIPQGMVQAPNGALVSDAGETYGPALPAGTTIGPDGGLVSTAGDAAGDAAGAAGLGDAAAAAGSGAAGAAGSGASLLSAFGAQPGAMAIGDVGAAAGGDAAAAAGGDIAADAGADAAAGAAGSSGVLASIGGLLTNPITIGIGAALAGALIWQSTQTHPVANTFVQQYQNPFGQNLQNAVQAFNKSASSGQMTQAQGQQALSGIQQLINGFNQTGQSFAQQGSKQQTVWSQAQNTMNQDFGPNFSTLLNGLQAQVSALPA